MAVTRLLLLGIAALFAVFCQTDAQLWMERSRSSYYSPGRYYSRDSSYYSPSRYYGEGSSYYSPSRYYGAGSSYYSPSSYYGAGSSYYSPRGYYGGGSSSSSSSGNLRPAPFRYGGGLANFYVSRPAAPRGSRYKKKTKYTPKTMLIDGETYTIIPAFK